MEQLLTTPPGKVSSKITVRRLILLLLILPAWTLDATARPMTPEQVPKPLRPWVGWVLHDHEELQCPLWYDADRRQCLWPGELEIEATPSGGRFRQRLRLFKPGRVRIPGDAKTWPGEVRSGDTSLAVLDVGGLPYVRLPAGVHSLTGRLPWKRMPPAVGIPPQTGIVRHVRNGGPVARPQRRNGSLWLRAADAGKVQRTPEDRLYLQVFRLVADGQPVEVTTHIVADVSGGQRETVLGYPLLEGAIPLRIDSPLPARLDPDGGLRVQLRPGRWVIRVQMRFPGDVQRLAPAVPRQSPAWPEQEVWVYRAAPADRLTEIHGVKQIDPRQVPLPKDWQHLPAYAVSAGDTFTITTIRRGDPNPEPDQLVLNRTLWLDFDGNGFTVQDRISGRMTSGWRLDMDPAFDLGQVTIDGRPQFITRLPGDRRSGVEVRRGNLHLVAESRLEQPPGHMPATGWGRPFQKVAATLHYPPGYRLIAVTGVDNVPASWLQRWTLYDLLWVLIITIAVGRLWGWRWAPLALVTLGLIWHLDDAPRMIWLLLLAIVALLRMVPEGNRFHHALRLARLLTLGALVLISLGFAVQQAREAIYPQLERPVSMAPPPPPSLRDEARQVRSVAKSMAGKALQSAPMVASDIEAKRRPKPPLEQIDTSAKIQTGPGLPEWQWHRADLQWNGPVAADQQIVLYLIGPGTNRVLKFATILLLFLLIWRFLDLRRDGGRWNLKAQLLLVALCIVAGDVGATGFPPPPLLEQLEQRLTEPQHPPPRAAIPHLHAVFTPNHYRAEVTVQAVEGTAVPLPVDTRLGVPLDVAVDGAAANDRLFIDKQGVLWALVPEGTHDVVVESYLPPVDRLQIPLPLVPHRVTYSAKGWNLDGVDSEGRAAGQLSLVRIEATQAVAGETLRPSVLPPFVRVTRELALGIEWEVTTRVTRESPLGTPIALKIPTLPGESVTTEGVTVKDGKVLATLRANQRQFTWRSRLTPAAELTLSAPHTRDWVETWRIQVGPTWHVTLKGIPPIHHQDGAGGWAPVWHPWAGEQVTLKISRPVGVDGNTLTIDRTRLTIQPGKRASDARLVIRLRSSQGDRLPVRLPEGARLQSVQVDGRTQPIRQEGRMVSLPVPPGKHRYQLHWRSDRGIAAAWRTPEIDLGRESVNARLQVQVPADRWILWTGGPRLGPAVLFWGLLAALVGLALVLGQLGRDLPLGTPGWLLLGVGLSQTNVYALALVAAWFFALRYRGTLAPADNRQRWWLNALQVGLVVLMLLVIGALLQAVQNGLLGTPQMQIAGNGSHGHTLLWYQDRVDNAYASAQILSAPLWVYRLLMMAWALWLAFSLLRWIRWGWDRFAHNGLWQKTEPWRKPPRKPAAAPQIAPDSGNQKPGPESGG